VFWRSFRPSSGAQNCVYSNGICQKAAAIRDEMESSISAPDDGREDCPKRVKRFTRINNLR